AIVHLHERVSLWQQIGRTEVEPELEGERREGERQREDEAHDEAAVSDQPGAEARHAWRSGQSRPGASGSRTGGVVRLRDRCQGPNVFPFTWSSVVATSM